MTGLRKKTAVTLDNMVEYILRYQETSGGKTPSARFINDVVGLSTKQFVYYRGLLEDSGRIVTKRIRPFVAKVNTKHPDNLRCVVAATERPPAVEPTPAWPPQPEKSDWERSAYAAFKEAQQEPDELLLDTPINPQPPNRDDFSTEWFRDALAARGWHVTLSQ